MLNQIAGIPAHPLFVHFAVVGAPVAAILAIVWLFRFTNRRLGMWTAIVSFLAFAGTLITKSTGEGLLKAQGLTEENPGSLADHVRYADMMTVSMGLVLVASLGLYFFAAKLPAPAQIIAKVILAIAAIATVVLTVLTGHAGAAHVWALGA